MTYTDLLPSSKDILEPRTLGATMWALFVSAKCCFMPGTVTGITCWLHSLISSLCRHNSKVFKSLDTELPKAEDPHIMGVV